MSIDHRLARMLDFKVDANRTNADRLRAIERAVTDIIAHLNEGDRRQRPYGDGTVVRGPRRAA